MTICIILKISTPIKTVDHRLCIEIQFENTVIYNGIDIKQNKPNISSLIMYDISGLFLRFYEEKR